MCLNNIHCGTRNFFHCCTRNGIDNQRSVGVIGSRSSSCWHPCSQCRQARQTFGPHRTNQFANVGRPSTRAASRGQMCQGGKACKEVKKVKTYGTSIVIFMLLYSLCLCIIQRPNRIIFIAAPVIFFIAAPVTGLTTNALWV